MNRSSRGSVVAGAGTALTGAVLGLVVGVLWWLITPSEQWLAFDGGLGAADLNSPDWFAADGWFLVLGVLGGLLLTGLTWVWARTAPVAMVVGLILGAALLALVAWSVGGLLGPPDPREAADGLAVGATIDGSLGLRALGVLAAPAVSALALVTLLLAMSPVVEDRLAAVPEESGEPVGS